MPGTYVRVWAISDETPGSATKGGGSTYARKHVKACESIWDTLVDLCISGPPWWQTWVFRHLWPILLQRLPNIYGRKAKS